MFSRMRREYTNIESGPSRWRVMSQSVLSVATSTQSRMPWTRRAVFSRLLVARLMASCRIAWLDIPNRKPRDATRMVAEKKTIKRLSLVDSDLRMYWIGFFIFYSPLSVTNSS